MANLTDEWLEALESRFGQISEIKEIQSEGKPKIFVFYFEDVPEKGLLTAITFGLSNAKQPDWEHGSVELMVTLETRDRKWGLGAGYFASAFFNEKRFAYGDVFSVDDPLSDESEMNAFLVFAPSFLDQEQSKIELSDRTIFLKGMYPLYDSEIALYNELGLKDFWHCEGCDIYNPRRTPIRIS